MKNLLKDKLNSLNYFNYDLFKFSNKLELNFMDPVTFVCDDYYLCKALGCDKGVIINS